MATPEDILTKKIQRVYSQAAVEVKRKTEEFWSAHRRIAAQMLADVASGKITQADYKKWLKGQVFTGERWKQKLDDITKVYVDADKKAREIIGGTTKSVFVDFANITAYGMEKELKGAVSFDLYDAKTVERLLKDNPQMLPEWKIDEPKDYIWNEKRVQNAVTQGIVQGESIADIGKRLTSELATSNGSKMDMFARTAINGAQNAGRMDRLHEAEEMGIEVRKKWLATLDSRTRDAHADLDGQEAEVDEPFQSQLGPIMYPGDPLADPANTYNCRCTLTYVYPKYQHLQHNHERRDQLNDKNIENMTYYEWVGLKKREEKPKVRVAEEQKERVAEEKPERITYSQKEKDAIEWYVSGDGQWINQYLRNPSDFGKLSDDEKEKLELITAATKRQVVQDKVLYRAVDAQAVFGKMSDIDFENLRSAIVYGDTSKSAKAMINRAQSTVGNTVTEKGFMSTTRDPEVAYNWNGYTGSTKDIALELRLPEGIHGFDVEHMFEVDEEQQREVLLERGLSYKITDFEKRKTEDGTVIVVKADLVKANEDAKKKRRR